MARSLKSVATKRDSFETAEEIAETAAEILYYNKSEHDVETDRCHARGCDHAEARRRIRIIDRAERLAKQHRAGDKFTMIVDALNEFNSRAF